MEKKYYPVNADNKTIAGLSCPAEIYTGFERFSTNNLKNNDDCVQLRENFLKHFCNYVHNIDVGNNIILTVGDVECEQLKKRRICSAG